MFRVDIEDDVELIWGIFTRFDCALDVVFTEQRFVGITPVYSGVMGIDATWKPGYQKPLEMDPEIVRLVDREMGSLLVLKPVSSSQRVRLGRAFERLQSRPR